ncbi:sulfatase family protein [Pedosphaera parvula]|nr:sulfatase [Pedosphaera parvula]
MLSTFLTRFNVPLLWLFLFLISAGSTSCAATQPPNVLFIIADQWRAEAMGYNGNPDVKTPHLDHLQSESVDFVNAVSSVPVCSPTRASLMTGQRALTHGVFVNDVPLSPKAITLSKVLHQAGYDTACIGKWHLDGHGRSQFIPRERRQNFDYWKVLECTHQYNNSFYFADLPFKLKWDGYDVFAQTHDASQYLRNHSHAKKPFFLYLSWGPPHDPYQTAPATYRSQYQAAKIKTRLNVPPGMRASAQTNLAGYYSHCTAIDSCVGTLLQTLKDTGLETNTLVIFTSDHGDMLHSHGLVKKQHPFDESIRVPLLMRWPAGLGTQPRKLDAPFNSPDFMPTILGLCGAPVPNTVEGIDYSAYLQGDVNPSDGATLISCPVPFGEYSRQHGGREYRGIRTTRYTYVRDLNGPWLLFDNLEDPAQMDNLVGQPECAQLEEDLEKILLQKLAEANDQFLPGQAYLDRWGYKLNANGIIPYTP